MLASSTANLNRCDDGSSRELIRAKLKDEARVTIIAEASAEDWTDCLDATGEIWFAKTPGGDWPVLVLTRDPVADRMGSVVVADLTRTRRGAFPSLN